LALTRLQDEGVNPQEVRASRVMEGRNDGAFPSNRGGGKPRA